MPCVHNTTFMCHSVRKRTRLMHLGLFIGYPHFVTFKRWWFCYYTQQGKKKTRTIWTNMIADVHVAGHWRSPKSWISSLAWTLKGETKTACLSITVVDSLRCMRRPGHSWMGECEYFMWTCSACNVSNVVVVISRSDLDLFYNLSTFYHLFKGLH